MSLDQTAGELRAEIFELRRALFVGASALLLSLMLCNLFLFHILTTFYIPRLDQLFVDLFGTKETFPNLTRLVFAYSRPGGGFLPQAFLFSFTVVSWSLMLMSLNRKNGLFLWIAIVAVFLLLLHLVLLNLAVEAPLMILFMVGIGIKA